MHITARLAKETAREYALKSLKDNIISLDLALGSMVKENAISSQLGLSERRSLSSSGWQTRCSAIIG